MNEINSVKPKYAEHAYVQKRTTQPLQYAQNQKDSSQISVKPKYADHVTNMDKHRSVQKISQFTCADCAYWKSLSAEIRGNMITYNNCGKRYNGACGL